MYNAWKREEAIVQEFNKVVSIVNQMSREIKRLGERRVLDLDLFPFKLYNLPDDFQPNPFSGSNWQTINVRGGYVFTTTLNTGSTFVNGTDRMEANSYYNFLQNPTSVGQYVVPITCSQYWFWVEKSGSAVSGSPYFLRYSSTPQTTDNIGNPNGWLNWPSSSNNSYVLGYADTNTSGAYGIMLVRQVQVGDILATAPPSFTASLCNSATGLPEVWTLYGYPSSSLG
jgi:hypothetical protein